MAGYENKAVGTMDKNSGTNIAGNNFLEKILDTTQTMIFWKDAERRFLGVNKAFLTYYGFASQDELIGRTDEEMGWHSDPAPFQDDEWRVLHEGISTHMVHGKCMARGEERDILASKGPVYEDGKIVGLVGSFIDVTEQYRQQDKIDELTRKLDGIPGGIAIYKRYYGELKCVSANHCLAMLLGTTPQDLMGQTMATLLAAYMEESSYERLLQENLRLDRSHHHAAGTYQFINKETKKPVWLHVTCQLVREADDEEMVYCAYTNVDKMVTYERELSEARHIAGQRYMRAMQLLNEGEERNIVAKGHYNFTQNQVLEYTTFTDAVYQFNTPMTYDAAFEGMLRLSYLASDFQTLQSKLGRQYVMESYRRGESHIAVNYRRILNDAEPMWIQLVMQAFINPATAELEGFSYAYDITEAVLKESIVARMGSLGYDELGMIYTGSRFWRCYQYMERQRWLHDLTNTQGDWDEEIARYVRENVIPGQGERVLKETTIPVIVAELAKAEVYSCSYTVRLPNGSVRQKELKFSYLNSVHETVFYCMTDVTDQFVRENEQIRELAAAKDEAERANTAKAAFFASISHDMRTPLNGVIGYTDLALEAADPETVRDYLKKIRISGGMLLSLINDVLDFGKFVVNKITLKPEPLKLQALCDSVDTVIRPLALNKHINFTVENNLTYDGFLEGDALRLQQLFVNLLSNSVKFTKAGGSVAISLNGADRGDYMDGTIVISDTGIGMSKEFLPLIFNAYSQEERRSASKTIGTGLGMAIVKQIVDLMGGTISVESEIDVGTTFTVHLSLRKYAGQDVPAMDMLTQGPGRYDLVLMDKRMLVMDGLQATRAIRRHEAGTGHHIPIIAMTGDVDEASIQSCVDSGMDAHVGKPIDRDELVRVLQRYCQRQQREYNV